MRRAPAVLAALALTAGAAAVVTTTGPASALEPGVAAYRFVPAQVFGDVAVGMPNERTVKIQHRDPTTGAWDAPSLLYKATGRRTCGAIEGQSSPGGVALLIECDSSYAEDQAPVESVAMVSRDRYTWAAQTLDGEAYRPPAISPTATYAAWLVGGHGEYVAWSASAGFAAPAKTTYDSNTAGETLVVDDAGTVTVLGPESQGSQGEQCVVGVHTRDLAGQRTHTVVPGVDPGCSDGYLQNVDALTVTGGGYDTAHRFTLGRADTASPWLLTRGAPVDAPGLISYGGAQRKIPTAFLETDDPSDPLVAVGSPDRRQVLAQTFDEASQTWGPQRQVYAGQRRCRDAGDFSVVPRSLFVFELRCGTKTTVLGSGDGVSWTIGKVGHRRWTYAAGLLALPDATGTTVVSPTGVQRFAATTQRRCDVVYPGAPGQLVRLHGSGAWPRKVQVSTGGRFRTVSTTRPIPDRCHGAFVDNTDDPPTVYLQGRRQDRYPRFVLRDGTWRVVYPRNPFGF